jgi:hypothetical protein
MFAGGGLFIKMTIPPLVRTSFGGPRVNMCTFEDKWGYANFAIDRDVGVGVDGSTRCLIFQKYITIIIEHVGLCKITLLCICIAQVHRQNGFGNIVEVETLMSLKHENLGRRILVLFMN